MTTGGEPEGVKSLTIILSFYIAKALLALLSYKLMAADDLRGDGGQSMIFSRNSLDKPPNRVWKTNYKLMLASLLCGACPVGSNISVASLSLQGVKHRKDG